MIGKLCSRSWVGYEYVSTYSGTLECKLVRRVYDAARALQSLSWCFSGHNQFDAEHLYNCESGEADGQGCTTCCHNMSLPAHARKPRCPCRWHHVLGHACFGSKAPWEACEDRMDMQSTKPHNAGCI